MTTSTTLLPVLKLGSSAFFDSMGGPIPCKIHSISTEHPEDTRPGSFQEVRATVSKDFGAYRKGQALKGWGLHFFPRDALGRSKYSLYIKPYRVQA
jgi:hypothetical protein